MVGAIGHGDDLDGRAQVDHDLEHEALNAKALGDQKAIVEEPEVARLLAHGVDAEVDQLAVPYQLPLAGNQELWLGLQHLVQLLSVAHRGAPLARHLVSPSSFGPIFSPSRERNDATPCNGLPHREKEKIP